MDSLPARRPAETGGLIGSVALLIGWALGADNPAVLAAIGIVVGAVPAAITWVVNVICRPRAALRQGDPADS